MKRERDKIVDRTLRVRNVRHTKCADYYCTRSRQNFADHPAFAFGRQSLFLPVVDVGQFGMIQAELMQQRGLEVIRGDDVFDRAMAEFVGLAERHSGLDASAGQPR